VRSKRIRVALALSLLATATLSAATASAITITSQVGTEAVGGVGVLSTLTGMVDTFGGPDGFIRDTLTFDLTWTHSYGAISGAIVSATLRVDLIDADTGILDLYAGTSSSDPLIGSASGGNQGTSVWRDLQTPPGPNPGDGSFDNLIVIPASLYADLADGTFAVFTNDRNDNLSSFGSNRALLTITVVPEPGTAALLGFGLIALGLARSRP
jgi:hypothetical protein